MRRRDVLRGAAGALALPFVARGAAHPGPYRPLGSVPVDGAKEVVVGDDARTAYVATTDGFATVDLSTPSDPTVLAERRDLLADREDGPLRQIYDVKVAGDRLVVAGPANPLDGDVVQGFLVYDVSDPADPERVAFQETDYAIHNCYLDGAVGYFTGLEADGSSLVVVDLAGDDPTEVARWSITSRDDRWSDVPWTLWPVHDVWVQDGLAALAHWDAGTWLVDVSDPADPRYVADVGGRSPADLADLDERAAHDATVALPGNSHFVTFDDDRSVLAVGEEAWNVDETGRGPGGITLYDVSDPTAPTRLSRVEPPATPDATFGGTWTTAHNFELRGDRLYSAWYQGGVKLHDVSDPAAPEELSWWRQPDEASFWTARVGVPGEFFVASSLGDPDPTREAVYVFPDEIGQQANPPALTNGSTGGGNGSIQQTATQTTTTPTTTTDGQSGVGFGVGLGAALYGAWHARR